MHTLDRYIIRMFLLNFAILLCVVTLLFVMIDFILDMDEFIRAGRDNVGGDAGVLRATALIMLDWYGPLLVLLYTFVSGLIVVGAMGFTFAQLARSGEITAIVTSGVSMYRIAAPVLVAGFALNLLVLPLQEWVIPPLATKLTREKRNVGLPTVERFQIPYIVDENNNLFSAAEYDPAARELKFVTIQERGENAQTVRRITAPQAYWDDQTQRWELVSGVATRPVATLVEDVQAFYRSDAQDFYETTRLTPDVLFSVRSSLFPRLRSVAELRRSVRSGALDAWRLQQIMHTRFSSLVTNLLVLVMVLPFFLLREPANMLAQAIKAAGLGVGAWLMGMGMLQMGFTDLPPVASAWLPVVVYLPVAALMLLRVRT